MYVWHKVQHTRRKSVSSHDLTRVFLCHNRKGTGSHQLLRNRSQRSCAHPPLTNTQWWRLQEERDLSSREFFYPWLKRKKDLHAQSQSPSHIRSASALGKYTCMSHICTHTHTYTRKRQESIKPSKPDVMTMSVTYVWPVLFVHQVTEPRADLLHELLPAEPPDTRGLH